MYGESQHNCEVSICFIYARFWECYVDGGCVIYKLESLKYSVKPPSAHSNNPHILSCQGGGCFQKEEIKKPTKTKKISRQTIEAILKCKQPSTSDETILCTVNAPPIFKVPTYAQAEGGLL